ncbi:hypothetical protein CDAR_40421 [Caerostris darwini]|uniref:Uncharacterized protein n=1 Tax=Caerostris darwini TaxID=1538125 RepID=A0AAV4RB32_9ARAC|nr:hypothetical protein CDAR_40421 [Caerostris darwini]
MGLSPPLRIYANAVWGRRRSRKGEVPTRLELKELPPIGRNRVETPLLHYSGSGRGGVLQGRDASNGDEAFLMWGRLVHGQEGPSPVLPSL